MNKNLKELLEIRLNKTSGTELFKEEFFEKMTDFIRNNSRFFNKSLFGRGNFNINYFFDIENSSNVITLLTDNNITSNSISKTYSTFPKVFGIETKINKLFNNRYNTDIQISDDEEKELLVNMLYKPFMKSIEKYLIGGSYFDKPLFNTDNQITGTNDFNGLLKLVRAVKEKNDDNIIVGNTKTINNIIDTIDNESYLNEYLLNGTIESVPVIGTVDSPETQNENILVGYDPGKICIVLTDDLSCKKFSSLNDGLNYFYQLFFGINGGDIFDNSIGLTV
jgi:hypothetical protein